MPRGVRGICRPEGQHPQQDHFETTARIRRQRQIATTDQAHLVIELHIFGRQGLRQCQHAIAVAVPVVDAFRQRLSDGHAVQHVENFREHAVPVRALFGQVTHGFEQRLGVAFDQRMQDVIDLTVIQRAEHRPHVGGENLAFTEGDGLIGQAHGVTHRTVSGATEQPQCIVFERHVFGGQDVGQMLDHTLRRHVLQRELQAARQNRCRKFLRVSGRQDELDVRRRLFEGFQQRIEGMAGKHVHFVDQVDLEAPTAWRVLHVVEQLAGVFDLGAARGVDLDQVDEAAFVDLTAHRALAARAGSDTCLTVQAFGNDPRNRGLTHPARTGKQVRVVQPLAVQGIDQSLEHMGLADHFAERARTPFTCKNLITHRKPSQRRKLKRLMLAEQGQNCIRCPRLIWLSCMSRGFYRLGIGNYRSVYAVGPWGHCWESA